jgi:hypothetical protein
MATLNTLDPAERLGKVVSQNSAFRRLETGELVVDLLFAEQFRTIRVIRVTTTRHP